MRTTVDLPDDIHQIALSLARSNRQTLSQTIADLLRRQLLRGGGPSVSVDAESGLPTVSLGGPVAQDDVSELEDDG